MSSKRVEDAHVSMLTQLLSESGLECVRTPSLTTDTSSLEEVEEQAPTEEHLEPEPEEVEAEEQPPEAAEVIPEEVPEVFPTPSLRRMVPDRIRRIEEQNRIHVLPETLKTEIDPMLIPRIDPIEEHLEPEPDEVGAEEQPPEAAEVIPEEVPEVFPTPSLRRMVPDRIRRIEEQNRIHVLPETFKTEIDPMLIPRIDLTEEHLEPEPEEVEAEEQPPEAAEVIPEEFPDAVPEADGDRIRRIEEQNRIHVLPETFKTEIDPVVIPRIATTPPQQYIDMLAELVGCKEYKSSLAEYWFLDTLANLLRRAQEDEMHRATQAVLILWFCEWMKEMQHFDAADRQRMLRRFQDNMLSAARVVGEHEFLPTPAQAGVYYKAREEGLESSRTTSTAVTAADSKHVVTFQGAAYECSLRDLTQILHYIFDLFSTDYQYDLVRSVFIFPPEYVLIDAPYQIQNPKRLFAPSKFKPKKKSPKKEQKGAKDKKKKEVETEEYLALLELIARDEREQEEREIQDAEQWNRRSHILPLQQATTEELFDKYWPAPPPEPVPEPEPEPKPKGKGKK